jgi:hypothetical protein
MRTTTPLLASMLALTAAASALLAAPRQTRQPGQMTQARVWIENRGRGEALPISLQEAPLDAPLRVRVMNGLTGAQAEGNEPLNVRIVRQPQVWQYLSVTVKPDENIVRALTPHGGAGWETTGVALTAADGTTTVLLKRLR